jgi:outer membrane receptor protein involved in Fe transport
LEHNSVVRSTIFGEILQSTASAGGLMNIACSPAVNPVGNGHWEGSSEENEFSGTVSLAYHLSDDVMVYGGYSRHTVALPHGTSSTFYT